MLKVIVTGPESSGKTTLCKQLSKHFQIPFTQEYARKYLACSGRNYQTTDLLKIAKGQLQYEQTTVNKQLYLQDTDLITIKIWSEYKFGNCNNWILSQIEKQKKENRFYLLCKPDIPWQADPLREHPYNRKELFELYKKELKKLAHNYFIIDGKNRFESGVKKIALLMS